MTYKAGKAPKKPIFKLRNCHNCQNLNLQISSLSAEPITKGRFSKSPEATTLHGTLANGCYPVTMHAKWQKSRVAAPKAQFIKAADDYGAFRRVRNRIIGSSEENPKLRCSKRLVVLNRISEQSVENRINGNGK